MVYWDHHVNAIEITIIEELFCEINKIRQSFNVEEQAGLQFSEPSCPISERWLIESLFYSLIPRLEKCVICRNFSHFPLHHSLKGILLIFSCSFRLSVGLSVICAVSRSTGNLQLCSSEYSSPLYSIGFPLRSIAVCLSSKPTVRQTLSIRIISRK